VESLQNALSAFLEYIPQLIGAIIILIVGYFVARILQAVVARVLKAIQRVAMRMGCMATWTDESILRRPPSEDR
jgi:uncharacterized protein YacL